MFALVMAGGVLAVAHRQARADPVVRRASVALPRWPADAPPVTVALLSDLHVGNAAMDAERLARIVTQVNRLKPDLVVIAGDFIAGHTPADASAAPQLAPLRRLTPRLGTIAVLGNHDYWTDPSRVRATLRAAGVTVLANEAVQRGPLAIGGLDDQPTHHDRLPATLAAMRRLGGASVMVAHSPDIAPGLPDDAPLLMAGHTHCGQIVLPLYGALGHVSRFGDRYRCGVVREGDRTTIVGAGLGTSVLPLRLGAPADLWLVRLSG
ncbi:metallophosphoesterase [Sphingomonas mollis]|uniref:metallophosphoesterase n=1 Tax=Sphingomonas mollis TaxID=2795726 RepID=UPI001E64CF14|nr:metallophosphoesterase [Sphingomonas sp. BT553]